MKIRKKFLDIMGSGETGLGAGNFTITLQRCRFLKKAAS